MSLPLIPFAKLPYKQWKENETEKKLRLTHIEHENQVFKIREENEYDSLSNEKNKTTSRERRLLARRRKLGIYLDESEEESSSSDGSDESSEYDLLEHIKDLLPDEVTKFGEKPKKKANTLHLEELKPIPKKRNYFAVFQRFHNSMEEYKARERERRKHHLLRHFEEKVKQYDLQQKSLFEELVEKRRNEELLEEYHRQKRIEKNSKKKVEKKLLAEQFSNDIDRREREDRQLLFYTDFFSQWRREEMDKIDEANRLAVEAAEKQRKEKEALVEKEQRRLLIESDLRLLREDEKLTRQVESMMLRSGTIYYQPKTINDDQEMVKSIFQKNKSYKERQKSLQAEKDQTMKQWREREEERDRQLLAAASGSIDGIFAAGASSGIATMMLSSMELVLDEQAYSQEQLQSLYKELKKVKFKRNAKIYLYFCPFKINLAEITSTSDIISVRGRNWKEIGLFAFCYEMTQNGHFLLMQHLDVSHCYIRNVGVQQLLYHLKINNLFALQSLNFTANHLNARIAAPFIEIAKLNLFQNLKKLNFSQNELHDEGIQQLVIPLIISKLMMNLEDLYLRQNSITNHGFEAIMKILIPLQDSCIPNIHRIALENNLIDGPCRRQFFPLPPYISV